MGYTRFLNGFTITSSAAVDRRIYLSKAEMLTAEDSYNLPAVYFCICTDDGKFYLYNENNTPNATTGKYRILDESITFTSEVAKAQLNEAIKNSVEIGNIKTEVAAIEQNLETVATAVTNVTQRVDVIEPKVTSLENRVDVLEPKVTDLEPKVITLETNVAKAEEDIEGIQTWINNVRLDGGEIKSYYELQPIYAFVTPDSSNPTTINYGSTANIIVTAATGYVLPETVQVNTINVGSTEIDCGIVKAQWNKAEGKLILSNPKNNVGFKIVAVEA